MSDQGTMTVEWRRGRVVVVMRRANGDTTTMTTTPTQAALMGEHLRAAARRAQQ